MNTNNKKTNKELKEALKNEVAPLLIGLRNEIKETNSALKEIASKQVPINELEIVMDGKKVAALKGNDGLTPIKDIDYLSKEKTEEIIKEALPKKGKDYFTKKEIKEIVKLATPVKGIDYVDGKDGDTPKINIEKISKEILEKATPIKGIHYNDGVTTVIEKQAEKITGEFIRNLLEGLKGKQRLSVKAIKDIEDLIKKVVLENIQQHINSIGGSGGESSGGGGHTIKEEGTALPQRAGLNFIGASVTATDNAGTNSTDITISSTGGGHTIQDEGMSVTQRTKLNFVGGGVTVTDGGAGTDDTIVTIPETTAAGNDGELQFNDGGAAFGASDKFIVNKTSGRVFFSGPYGSATTSSFAITNTETGDTTNKSIITFNFNDDMMGSQSFANILASSPTITAGDVYGDLTFQLGVGGTVKNIISIDATATGSNINVINTNTATVGNTNNIYFRGDTVEDGTVNFGRIHTEVTDAGAGSDLAPMVFSVYNYGTGLTDEQLRLNPNGTGVGFSEGYVQIPKFLQIGPVANPEGQIHAGSDTVNLGQSYLSQSNASADSYDLNFRKSRGTGVSPTVITTADELGVINFSGYGGASGYVTGAAIKAISSGTIADTRVPGQLEFWTGTDATPSVLTRRLYITNAGSTVIGSTSFTSTGVLSLVNGNHSMGDSNLNSTQSVNRAAGSTLNINRTAQNTANVFSVTMGSTAQTNTSGTNGALAITPVYNQASGTGANTDLLINRTQTAIGSGAQYLIDAQVGGASQFSVSNTGTVKALTSLTTPLVIGGTETTQDLSFKTTSGVGATGADMHFLVGNNGATEAMTILNNGNVGIQSTAILAPLTLGSNNVNNSVDAVVLVSRAVDTSIAGNGHCFSDSSTLTRTGTIGYNSYDGRITVSVGLDHYAAFQAIPIFTSGTTTNYYGLYAGATHNGGTITNWYGVYTGAATSGSGSIGTMNGVYIATPSEVPTSVDYGLRIAARSAAPSAHDIWLESDSARISMGASRDLILTRDSAYTLQLWVDTASPLTSTIQGNGAVGTNITGAAFQVGGGQGTGTGAGGPINFRVAPAGSTGASQNAYVTAATITSTSRMGIATTAPDKVLEVNLGTSDAFRLTYNDANGSAATYMDTTVSSTGLTTFTAAGSAKGFVFSDPIRPKGYTVATLPTGVQGDRAFVTDALAPAFLATVVGGGAAYTPVSYSGSAWVCG